MEILDAAFSRIRAVDPAIRAFLTLMEETARKQAASADERIARGQAGPLTGIPVALKDNLCTRGRGRPAHRGSSGTSCPRTTPRSSPRSTRPAPSSSARQTWTSSPWGRPRRTPPFRSPGTPGTRKGSPADRRAARRPLSRPTCAPLRSEATPAARSASRPPVAGSSDSSPRTGASPGTDWSRSPPLWTRSGRWRRTCATRP